MKIEMYTSNSCPFCEKAKTLLKMKGVEWIEYNIQEDPTKVAEVLQRSGGKKTVPQIFINNKHIGGYSELQALDTKGELDSLLK